MKLRKVQSRKDWREIKKLYNEAFPANEKKPFWMIWLKHRGGAADVWVAEQEGEFSGMAITMNGADLVLLDYFAVSSDKRSCGIGGAALKALQEAYKGHRFFLEIESIEEGADTQAERERRKKFYLTNGMQELGVQVTLFGVDMELLGYNCKVNFDEYRGLYFDTYGNWAAKNVLERS
ncbi:MAG: GNAT family N-acetyltransferase [Lachnospiraceae bacterium]|nr:GNAT family N-acetyltransferase [Lachnospiraceae bacterium]